MRVLRLLRFCLDIFFVDHCSLVCEGGHIDERVPACPPAAGDHDAAANANASRSPRCGMAGLGHGGLAKSSDVRCLRYRTCRPSCEPPCGQR